MTSKMISRFRLGTLCMLSAGLAVAGCGGKGDDVPPTPSNLKLVASDGDSFPGNFEVGNIESANMADDGTIAIIASESSDSSLNAVFVRSPEGELRTVMRADNPLAEGLSFANVRNLAMARTGEFAFEVGNRFENDGLFFWDGSELSVLARTAPGETPDGFKILGALRITAGGEVAFTDGQSPCTIDSTEPGDPEVECDVRIWVADDGVVSRVEVPNTLTSQRPTAVLLESNSGGEVVVGMSARGNEPMVGIIQGGEFEGLLQRRARVEGLGVLTSARPRAISATGAVVLDGFVDEDDDGVRDREHILFLKDGFITSVAVTGGAFEGNPEVDLRAEGISDDDMVVYRVDFESEPAGEVLRSLRAFRDGRRIDIAHEGLKYGEDRNGNDQRILDIGQTRVAANGDVLFVAKLGDKDPQTGDRRVSGTALIRWAGSSLSTVLELGAEIRGGSLVNDIGIADVDSNGNLLLLSSRNRSASRVLMVLKR